MTSPLSVAAGTETVADTVAVHGGCAGLPPQHDVNVPAGKHHVTPHLYTHAQIKDETPQSRSQYRWMQLHVQYSHGPRYS